ncbi:MAG: alpha/beta hydrolase [Janibacter sp.]
MDTSDTQGIAPSRRRLLGAGLTGAAVTGLGLAVGAPAQAAARSTGGLTFADGHGLTVRDAQRWDWERRLVYLRLGTGEITGWGGGGPGVNVLLPKDYDDNPDKRYPVVHLYHGGGSEVDFRAWHSMGNQRMLLDTTRDVDAIFVMPDISKGGWGLDARLEWFGLRRNWATFHFDQLIPWVDANLRTIPDGAARAVAGHSMGGFAAVHHMAKRPELFAAVTNFSGPSDFGHPSLQTYAYVSPVVDQLQPGALLGPPTKWSTDMVPVPLLKNLPPLEEGGDPAVWDSENPRAHLDSFKGKRVSLVAGTDTADPNEGPVIKDQPQFAELLRGHGVDVTQYQLTGAHTDTVLTAFPKELPAIMASLTKAG